MQHEVVCDGIRFGEGPVWCGDGVLVVTSVADGALWHLAHGRGRFALVSARALVRRTVAPEQIKQAGARLGRDEDYPPEDLVELLLASGYVR